jgi:hypothetical protein
MAPNFQSSFIPKEPMTEDKVFKPKKAGILGVAAVSIFIISILGAIGMYVYEGMIKSEIQSLESQLATAEKGIDKKTINDMTEFGNKLQAVGSIISKHEVISGFLNSLASSTVSTVQFTDFSYGDMKSGSLTISLKGKANSYAAVALQEKIFSQEKYFSSLAFSNLNLTDKGMVSFDLVISVEQKISVYAPKSGASTDTSVNANVSTSTNINI